MENSEKYQIKQYAAAVHRRNVILKKLYEARTPRIGIFFFDNDELWADAIPIRYGCYVKGLSIFNVADDIVNVTHKHTHFEGSIDRLKRQARKAPKTKKISLLLRGRVAYDRKKRKYVVIADKEILCNDIMISDIVAEFCLPDQRTCFERREGGNTKR